MHSKIKDMEPQERIQQLERQQAILIKALRRVEEYLERNVEILAPFPTRSELDNIRFTIKDVENNKI